MRKKSESDALYHPSGRESQIDIAYMHKVIHLDFNHILWPDRMRKDTSDYGTLEEDLLYSNRNELN